MKKNREYRSKIQEYTCGCGSIIKNKPVHDRTKKHINYIAEQANVINYP